MDEQIKKLRSELKNIRQTQRALKADFQKDVDALCRDFDIERKIPHKKIKLQKATHKDSIVYTPIGHIESAYTHKNGTPRQGSLCAGVLSKLQVTAPSINNPHHSLQGLHEFSHVWLLFHFHDNSTYRSRNKVRPPRKGGASVGVFACRSPHRPNPLGLTLASLVRVEGSTLYLSHTDLLHGTPIIDIKPYIPSYDAPKMHHGTEEDAQTANECGGDGGDDGGEDGDDDDGDEDSGGYADVAGKDDGDEEEEDSSKVCRTAGWVEEEGRVTVSFTRRAIKGLRSLKRFHRVPADGEVVGVGGDDVLGKGGFWVKNGENVVVKGGGSREVKDDGGAMVKDGGGAMVKDGGGRKALLGSVEALKGAIKATLSNDPRSVYRRQKCTDKLYYFCVDHVHVTCWFDEESGGGGGDGGGDSGGTSAEVLRVRDE